MNQTPRHQFSPPRVSVRETPHEPDMVDVGALFATLWRGKVLISLLMAAAITAGTYYAYLIAAPQFRSTVVLMLNTRDENVVDIGSVVGALSAESSVVNTEVEVLKSRSLLAKLVTELSLDADPEFNRYERTPSAVNEFKLLVKRHLNLTTPSDPLPPSEDKDRAREATIDGLLGKLTIRNLPQSLVFQITAETKDPKKSALVANTLADLYISNQLDVKFDATKQATAWLAARVSELQSDLEIAESKVKVFRTKTDLVSSDTLAGLEAQLKDVRDRISTMKQLDSDALARMDAIKSASSREDLAQVLQDPQLTRLLPQLASARMATAFDTRVTQITNRAEGQVLRGATQMNALETSQAELETQIARQSDDLITLQQLSREAEASRLLYEYFLGRFKETSAQQGIQQADSRVLSSAVVPTLPASPNRPVIVILSALFGLGIGSVLVLLREARTDTFRTSEKLEDLTGYPVMGQISTLPTRRRKDAVAYLVKKPMSAAAEAVRNLRTSVVLSNATDPPQVIVTCSSLPGEGKTTVAIALAQNMAGMGKRVLLIEGDIRRRTMQTMISGDDRGGLMSVITEKMMLADAVVPSVDFGADVLLGGQVNMNAADAFSSDAFSNMLDDARAQYDHIIIDTPPVLIVPDARIIAQSADALLFVVKWDATRTWQVENALAMFESVQQKISGFVLNQINPGRMRRYGEAGQFYDSRNAHGRKYYVN